MKVLIVGFDGATWSVMRPMLEKGRLPNIQAVMREGSSGVLETIDAEKFLSPALWTSIETGKHPDKHGVKDFYKTTRYDVKVKRLYHMLDGLDGKIGHFRWYCTWPAEKSNGFTVPSWVARNTETYPPELEFIMELARHSVSKGYVNSALMCLKNGVRIGTLAQGAWRLLHKKIAKPDRRDWYYKERVLEARLYGEMFAHLYGAYQPNYGAILFSPVDALQHQYWKYFEPNGFDRLPEKDIRKYKAVIPEIYMEMDRFIGKIRNLLSDEDLLLIVSDHGMHSMKMERGRSRSYQVRATSLLRLLKLDDVLTSFNANFKTCIMIRNQGAGDQEGLINQAIERIGKIHVKKTGASIFDVTSIEEDRFFIKFKEDVGYSSKMEISGIPDHSCILYDLIIDKPEISACHHPDGIFVIKGPHVRRDLWVDRASLLDVTPTILRLFNQPIAKDMDGRALEEVMEDDFLAQYSPEEIETYEDKDKSTGSDTKSDDLTEEERKDLESRLRSLGYLD